MTHHDEEKESGHEKKERAAPGTRMDSPHGSGVASGGDLGNLGGGVRSGGGSTYGPTDEGEIGNSQSATTDPSAGGTAKVDQEDEER